MQTAYYFILVPMVYIALALFIIGTTLQGVRILLGLRYSLRRTVGPEKKPKLLGAIYETFILPKALAGHPIHWAFLITFHVSFLLLMVGHLELIGEISILQVIKHEVFLGGGVVGITLFVALLFFLLRRFHSPVGDISEPQDYYMLLLLLGAVMFGSQLHLARKFFGYSSMGVEEYREYLCGILTFRPALPDVLTEDCVGHSFLLVVHVFLANLFLMVFPWSNMMHSLLALPLARLRRR